MVRAVSAAAGELEALKVLSCEREVLRAAVKRGLDDEDGLQVGRMAALKAVRQHDPRRGYLDLVAWRWISSYLDREVRRRARVARDSYAPPSASVSTLNEDAVAVRLAIEHLPERLRKIVHARMAGFTLAEIGVEMGVSRERVRQLELRAARLLRGLLATGGRACGRDAVIGWRGDQLPTEPGAHRGRGPRRTF